MEFSDDKWYHDRYMYYFSSFGFLQERWEMVLGFSVVSLASALVESLPISSELDDNLTVPLTSILVGILVFWFHEWGQCKTHKRGGNRQESNIGVDNVFVVYFLMNMYLLYTNFLDSLIRYLDVPCHLINVIYTFICPFTQLLF